MITKKAKAVPLHEQVRALELELDRLKTENGLLRKAISLSRGSSQAQQNETRIVARLRTWCACGHRVRIGSHILWNKMTRETIGCERCMQECRKSENEDKCPDPEFHPDALWAYPEDYEIFHQ